MTADELTERGEQLLAAGDWNAALTEFSRALDLDPDHAGARDGMARAHEVMDREVEHLLAADDYAQVSGLVARGEVLVAAGDVDAGVALLVDAAAAARGVPDAYVRITDRALYLRPGLLPLAHDAARQRLATGAPRHALAILQPCFKRDPGDIATLDLLVEAFTAIGQPAKAAAVRAERERISPSRT